MFLQTPITQSSPLFPGVVLTHSAQCERRSAAASQNSRLTWEPARDHRRATVHSSFSFGSNFVLGTRDAHHPPPQPEWAAFSNVGAATPDSTPRSTRTPIGWISCADWLLGWKTPAPWLQDSGPASSPLPAVRWDARLSGNAAQTVVRGRSRLLWWKNAKGDEVTGESWAGEGGGP